MEDKQYYIYIRSTNEQIPVTKEEFDNYYRDINAYRKKQQRHGRCVCPSNRRLMCDMDCLTCPFKRTGDIRYLDATIEHENGYIEAFYEKFADDTPSPEEIVCELDLLKSLCNELQTLTPDDYDICSVIMSNLSDRKAAEKLGIPRNTYTYRKKKVLEQLREALQKFL